MIELHNIKRGQLDDNGFVRIASSSADLAQRGLFVDDSPAISVGEIKAQCRKLKAKHGLDLVVVDYIGLVESGKKQETRQIEISTISRELKCMAMELGVAVIAVSQLNRAPEARRGNRPQLGDLRESGAIEQDADIVLLLYRDEYYNPDSKEKGVARCIIAKNRNGEVGDKQLGWNGQYQKFVDINKKDYI
jgi:replicative DNA helicase